jgi:hypothetical protein
VWSQVVVFLRARGTSFMKTSALMCRRIISNRQLALILRSGNAMLAQTLAQAQVT